MRRKLRSLIPLAAVASALWAQDPPDVAPTEATIRSQTFRVLAPTTVLDRNGVFVDDIKPSEFHVLDNGKYQAATVDVTQAPLAVVVAIQASYNVDPMIPKIQKIGPLLAGLVTGDQGQAAILSFDHRIQTLQDFTSDSALLTRGLEKLKAGSGSSRMIDAMSQGIDMLKRRPKNYRRILLMISETRDKASEGRLKDVLTSAQFNDVLVYALPINRLVAGLNSKTPTPRPDPIPPGGRYIPGGGPQTPLEAARLTGTQGNGINFVPVFEEIFKDAKAIFVDNPLEAVTKFTGGSEFNWTSQRDLERAFETLGRELHSQYMLSYAPDNRSEPGYHTIQVTVARKNVEIRTRPGWYAAPSPTE